MTRRHVLLEVPKHGPFPEIISHTLPELSAGEIAVGQKRDLRRKEFSRFEPSAKIFRRVALNVGSFPGKPDRDQGLRAVQLAAFPDPCFFILF
jgi:hypothetical protein